MKILHYFITKFLNLICPPQCPICHKPIEEPHTLCPSCYAKLHFLAKPCCEICGRPFEYVALDTVICGACAKHRPYFSMARAVLSYDSFSKHLILAYKHGDHTELTPLLVKFLRQADKAIFENIDVIVPVPLHWTRALFRRFNQAALLGQALARATHIPFSARLLKRVRHTPSQGHMNQKQREKNVKNAFTVPRQESVKDRRILVIDDVMTTGATLNECARTLLKAGAKEVKVITLYRVLR